jgi:uncharacterized membrane protein
MKSKASIKGHSIHPILIAVPVAFFYRHFNLRYPGFGFR